MKKIALTILLVLVFTLSACGGVLPTNAAQVIPTIKQVAVAAQASTGYSAKVSGVLIW